jgi:SAM-dependent methyltransferase
VADVYSAEFFANQRSGSLNSAAILLPLLIDLLEPRSLLDVGCGQGTWLKSALALGLKDQLGVDGEWAQPVLAIPVANFRAADVSRSFDLGRKFDLAISMEVGEHIDAARADGFVGNIVRHADVAVFSAAAPFQGGIHHINEQWPSYWARKFAEHRYRCFDFLRWRIWNDKRISTWYRQNLLIFANETRTGLIARLEAQQKHSVPETLSVIHPEIWNAMMNSKSLRLQRSLAPALRRVRTLFRAQHN